MDSGLSDHVLNLKFMAQALPSLEEDEKADSEMKNDSAGQKRIRGPCVDFSFNNVYDLSSGRWSFQNFNPEVESYLRQRAKAIEKKDGAAKEVHTERQYSSVSETISKKFKSKRNRGQWSKKQNVDRNKWQNRNEAKSSQNTMVENEEQNSTDIAQLPKKENVDQDIPEDAIIESEEENGAGKKKRRRRRRRGHRHRGNREFLKPDD